MKVTIIDANDIKIIDRTEPVCRDGEVVVKLKACGICGSDLANIYSRSCKPTEKLGHEIAGIISKIGLNVKNLKIGDRIIVNHHCSCGKCRYCLHNNETMCLQFTTQIEPCGFAEQILVSKWIVDHGGIIKIPSSLSFEEATLIEPLACCIRAWKKISYLQNDSVAIFGFGPIGALHAILAKNFGLNEIFCIDKVQSRLDFCKSHKIGEPIISDNMIQKKILEKTKNDGVDIVIIATSDFTTVTDALKISRRGGKIMIFGEPKYMQKISIDMNKLYSKEISVLTSYASTNEDMMEALRTIEKKPIEIIELITHKFTLEQVKEAVNYVRNEPDRMKVIITHD